MRSIFSALEYLTKESATEDGLSEPPKLHEVTSPTSDENETEPPELIHVKPESPLQPMPEKSSLVCRFFPVRGASEGASFGHKTPDTQPGRRKTRRVAGTLGFMRRQQELPEGDVSYEMDACAPEKEAADICAAPPRQADIATDEAAVATPTSHVPPEEAALEEKTPEKTSNQTLEETPAEKTPEARSISSDRHCVAPAIVRVFSILQELEASEPFSNFDWVSELEDFDDLRLRTQNAYDSGNLTDVVELESALELVLRKQTDSLAMALERHSALDGVHLGAHLLALQQCVCSFDGEADFEVSPASLPSLGNFRGAKEEHSSHAACLSELEAAHSSIVSEKEAALGPITEQLCVTEQSRSALVLEIDTLETELNRLRLLLAEVSATSETLEASRLEIEAPFNSELDRVSERIDHAREAMAVSKGEFERMVCEAAAFREELANVASQLQFQWGLREWSQDTNEFLAAIMTSLSSFPSTSQPNMPARPLDSPSEEEIFLRGEIERLNQDVRLYHTKKADLTTQQERLKKLKADHTAAKDFKKAGRTLGMQHTALCSCQLRTVAAEIVSFDSHMAATHDELAANQVDLLSVLEHRRTALETQCDDLFGMLKSQQRSLGQYLACLQHLEARLSEYVESFSSECPAPQVRLAQALLTFTVRSARALSERTEPDPDIEFHLELPLPPTLSECQAVNTLQTYLQDLDDLPTLDSQSNSPADLSDGSM
ncbi:MAG: uncharacterized protein KVP18_001157 [Porospora cf. gigantea A]|uniref:uncharacterized protein n=1 Tax=Porospora cf. gigantea A TaxID=2853593 RepID=UPI00355A3522|nr:MAG: hypothetical protein KVP18_001157 [Porospora cf. gigantea A]